MNSLISSAESNDKHSQAKLSLAYFIGDNIEKDLEKGFEWFRKASDDMETLQSVFSLESVLDHPDACVRIYGLWKTTNPVSNERHAQAIPYLIAAAQGGIADAQHLLAIECAQGCHIPDEYRGNENAIHWHLKSLEKGHSEAHRYLAAMYSGKRHYKNVMNPEKAFYHLSQIVEQGDYNTTESYGMAFVNGFGVDKNLIEGVKWLFISKCRAPNFSYVEKIERAVAKLTPEEYQIARSAAIDWIKANAHTASGFHMRKGLVDPISREPLDISLDNEPELVPEVDLDKDNAVTAKIIPKWHQYIAGVEEVSEDDVYTLLMEGASTIQLQDIFQHYDNKDELITRYQTARKPGTKETNIESIAAAARADMLFKYKLCLESGLAFTYEYLTDDLSEEHIQNCTVKHVSEEEFEEQRRNIFYEAVSEIISDELDAYDVPGSIGLNEVLTGALQDYNLKNHVLCALITKKDWNFNAYLDVIRMGAEYDLSGNNLLIKINPRRKIVA